MSNHKSTMLLRMDLIKWLNAVCKNYKDQAHSHVIWLINDSHANTICQNMVMNYGSIIDLISRILTDKSTEQPYGKANETDFQESAQAVAKLFAYDNKHFYVYKAISNPNKLGYLSRKQYYKMTLLIKNATRLGYVFNTSEYLKNTGRMASPFKLLKQAFKENAEATKLISRWFPIQEDGKLKYEDVLIMITNQMLRMNTEDYQFIKAPIDECYAVNFPQGYGSSGPRYCSHSCMYGHEVQGFYENLPVEGYLVMKNGAKIGRFLYWTLPDGKHYVDRLYVISQYANDVLSEIDQVFKDDYKYAITDYKVLSNYFIPFKSYNNMEPGSTFPYIDSFPYLFQKGDEYFLCATNFNPDGYRYIGGVRTTRVYDDTLGFLKFKCCGKRHWKSDKGVNVNTHKLYCEKYVPRKKKDRALLACFRKLMEEQYV